MDLFEDDGPAGDNAPEFTVSELSGAVKRTIEGNFDRVRVRGELGRVSRPRSGHVYLDLKDDRAVLAGVIWKGQAAKLATQPEEGLEVVVTGRLTTFPGQSKYQIIIDTLAPAGVGALMAMLEKRKAALQAEGLFAPERKKPLPYLPEVIGVVTSPSGAVIRDILHRLRDRFPRKVLIWPVAVQGERCAPEVARAIAGFNALSAGGALPRPDLLIVARGGGSIEDLWGFNEEIVARAAAASEIPLISAVGHETDTTLIDFVADRRAPTPTAAAELAVPVRAELLAWTAQQGARLTGAQARMLRERGQRLRDLSRALPRAEELTRPAAQRLDLWADRLPRALITGLERRHTALARRAGALRPSLLVRLQRAEGRRLADLAQRFRAGALRDMDRRRRDLDVRAARLSPRRLSQTQAQSAERLVAVARRLDIAGLAALAGRRERLEATGRLLAGLGYRETLARGFAVVRGGGHVVTDAAGARTAGPLELEFRDGRVDVGPATDDSGGAGDASPAPKRKTRQTPPSQPTLFDD